MESDKRNDRRWTHKGSTEAEVRKFRQDDWDGGHQGAFEVGQASGDPERGAAFTEEIEGRPRDRDTLDALNRAKDEAEGRKRETHGRRCRT